MKKIYIKKTIKRILCGIVLLSILTSVGPSHGTFKQELPVFSETANNPDVKPDEADSIDEEEDFEAALRELLGVAELTGNGEEPPDNRDFSYEPEPEEPRSPPVFVERGVLFSHEAGFYSEEFYLELFPVGDNDGEVEIYYTTDGSPPATSSARKKYTEPILVTMPEPFLSKRGTGNIVSGVNLLTISAVTVIDGIATEPSTRSFVRGTDVHERFDKNTHVFSIYTDPHGLYDSREGIFTNYSRRGDKWERAAHAEMFIYDEYTGKWERYISQRVGIRVKGGGSRSWSHKSVELYANRSYGDGHNLEFPFFDTELDINGEIIQRYRRVRLRSGSNDRHFGMLRDELGHDLYRKAGFADMQSHVPTAFFLNGEYYGFSWLKSPRTENHWQRRYGGVTENFEHIGGCEMGRTGEKRAIDDWAGVRALAQRGLTNEERWQEFQNRVCVDNFLLYYAVQIYVNNEDWLNNNFEMWRYYPTEAERNDPRLHPFLRDGKWRFIAQDVEVTFNLYGAPGAANDRTRRNTIHDVLLGSNAVGGRSVLFPAVMARDDMRKKFANTLVDLMEGAISPESVEETLERLIALNSHEVRVALFSDTIHPGHQWPNPESISKEHNNIRDFARRRPELMLGFINTTLSRSGLRFNANERYPVEFTVGSGGEAMMNLRPVGEGQSVTGNYYAETEIELTAKPFPGYAVDYWTVNGERLEGDTITIDSAAEVELRFVSF